MNSFKDSLVVITGAGSGIGAALAREAAKRGARLAVADIRLDSAKQIAEEIGGSARAYHVDVTDPASVESLASAVQNEMGNTNLLFANAGVVVAGGLPETQAQDFDWLFDVNVAGLYRTIIAFLPAISMQATEGKPAHIITTGSENSFGLPSYGATTAYTAAKHAVLGLSDGLRRDLKDNGIRVSILCPGIVVTNLANARSNRQERYGGAIELAREHLDGIVSFMRDNGQLPAETALLCCEAVERGEFIIMADLRIRGLARTRYAEIEAALNLLDARRSDGKDKTSE